MKTQVTEYQGVKVINPKNSKLVKTAINWLIKHNDADRLRNIADGEGDEKAYNKANRRCESTFDKYLDTVDQLPKNQIKLIENSNLY